DTTFANGKVDQAFSFDGTNDSVTVAPSPALDPNPAFSVDAWVYWKGNINGTGFEGIVIKAQDSTAGSADSYGLFIRSNGGLYSGVNGTAFETSGGVIPTNQWTHVAETFDVSTAILYVNGAQMVSQSGISRSVSSGPLTFGVRPGGGHYL